MLWTLPTKPCLCLEPRPKHRRETTARPGKNPCRWMESEVLVWNLFLGKDQGTSNTHILLLIALPTKGTSGPKRAGCRAREGRDSGLQRTEAKWVRSKRGEGEHGNWLESTHTTSQAGWDTGLPNNSWQQCTIKKTINQQNVNDR